MQSLDDNTTQILKSYIQRIEKLEQEKQLINTHIKDMLLEAKDKGFSPLIIRKVIRSRQMDEEKLIEQEALYELYKKAIE